MNGPWKPPTAEIDPQTVDVLIVDDDAVLREGLLECLQQEGFVAIAAADGAEALRLAADRSPRIILLDLEMPGMNGWQFLERRQADARVRRIPVLVVSGLGAGAVSRQDVAAQLQKPVDIDLLCGELRLFLDAPGAAQLSG